MDTEIPGLPDSLRPISPSPFVGRAAELERLRTLMPWAEGEGRRVALLAGEPGAGKSRLAREFAAGAASEGALVLYGACDAVVRTPYGPFVEALDRLVRVTEAEELRAALGSGAAELARLLPDLPAVAGELPEPVEADPDTERHRLHTAVADLLANVSRERPMLLVLEDAHWADAPTLLLLRFLARAAWRARLLILVTFRDTEADKVPGGLAETLADLRRADDVLRMRLPGLSEAEVSDLVSRAAGDLGRDPELPELASTIHDLTGGNAFLVCELWRALLETGTVEVVDGCILVTRPLAELATPESVSEVVSQRLSRLAPSTSDLLELAAVAGPEFELEPIGRAAKLTEPELLAALEEAIGSGMIEELPSQRMACRFTHEIVRRALYDRLSQLRRAELHLSVGEALEGTTDAASDRGLADLAHHFGSAAPFGGAKRAIEYNLRAARAASASLAYDDAATRLGTALEIGIEDEHERAAALLELGWAGHRAGKATDAVEAFAAAAEIARGLGSAELLAQAAIGYEESCWRPGLTSWRPGLTSQDAVELLEEALTAVGGGSGELRISLLAGLSRALDFQGERERGGIVRENGVALARRLDDRPGLAKVLVRSYWARGTTPLPEILPMLTEAMELAEELDDSEAHTEAIAWRVPTLVSLGDLVAARVGGRRPAGDGRADRAAVHESHRRALRVGDRPRGRRPGGGRGDGRTLARVGRPVDRTRRNRQPRHPDVRHSPRAGTTGGAGAGGQDPGRRGRPRGAMASRARRRARRARHGGRREEGALEARRGGHRRVPGIALAGDAHLPDRCFASPSATRRWRRSSTRSWSRSRGPT